MGASEPITLSRACEVIEIPSGIHGTLPASTVVRIMQSLGSGYTVATDRGYMYRIDAKDTDALGLANEVPAQAVVRQNLTCSVPKAGSVPVTLFDSVWSGSAG